MQNRRGGVFKHPSPLPSRARVKKAFDVLEQRWFSCRGLRTRRRDHFPREQASVGPLHLTCCVAAGRLVHRDTGVKVVLHGVHLARQNVPERVQLVNLLPQPCRSRDGALP